MSEVEGGIDEAPVAPKRRSRLRVAALLLLLILLTLLLLVWIQRKTIASDYIDRELQRRGVRARYEVTALGFGRQRLENVVIGDPARPDLVARRVDLRLSWGLRAPKVAGISAQGVRMFGRLSNGKLSLGELDKLLPAPTGAPFRLPDMDLALDDAGMRLQTDAGVIGLAVRGSGNLAGGFAGKAAAVSRRLTFGECRIEAPRALIDLSVAGRRPRVKGPIRGEGVQCGDNLAVASPSVTLDATLSEAADAWRGTADVRSGAANLGDYALGGVVGTVSFDGNRGRTTGRADLAADHARLGDSGAGRIALKARYDYSPKAGLALDGDAAATRVVAGPRLLAPVAGVLASLAGSPLDPLARSLSSTVRRAGESFDAGGTFRITHAAGHGTLKITRFGAASRSGARLSLAGGDGLGIDLATGLVRLDGRMALEGGGFPRIQGVLSQPRAGAPLSGSIRVAPFAANGARLAFSDVSLVGMADGSTRVRTIATIDGPFSDGRVRGLVLPVEGIFGRNGFLVGSRCTAASFEGLQYSSLRLGATRLALCPTGRALVWKQGSGAVQGGAQVAPMRLAGTLGSSPIALSADRFRFELGSSAFSGSRVAVRLGQTGSVTRLDLGSLTGRITRHGVAGRFAGTSGKIANVPLLLSDANGRWTVSGGKAVVDGALIVSDEANPSRFYPLASKDLHLVVRGNRIDAKASLIDPDTGTGVATTTIVHALDTGRGSAVLDIPGIVFNPGYQPEQLTRLTTGVVALVDGTLKGEGRIAWGPEGTTSTGVFSTRDMNLAAAFGPVTGLTTTINFTDLLGLETAPGQVAEVDRIQAGIDVYDGRVTYALLSGLRVRVESARWPFAGGELLLDDTTLDFSRPTEKRLTFRLVGMDAAAFVQQMEFGNISATGTFDGVVPMVFDQRGGHVVGGNLRARPSGGVVSYVGELTDKQLGTYGKLAFDALKSLRYSLLTIDLNGSLDGEFVAGIELDGVARNAPNPGGIVGGALKQIAKIPFEFNITARGPFRSLIGMMRSFDDPSALIQSVLPQRLQDQPTTKAVQPEAKSVQTQESETVR